MRISAEGAGVNFVQVVSPCLAALFFISGCAVFKGPRHDADGPTVPTGVYDSKAERWQDEALAAQRKAEKEKTEKELKKFNRE